MKKNLSCIVLMVLCCFLFCPQVFAATSLTLYDDFNDNTIDPGKWLVEPTENAGAITEDNGTLKISSTFDPSLFPFPDPEVEQPAYLLFGCRAPALFMCKIITQLLYNCIDTFLKIIK